MSIVMPISVEIVEGTLNLGIMEWRSTPLTENVRSIGSSHNHSETCIQQAEMNITPMKRTG